ncbi:hypothetical protein PAHAL_6G272800 [Panicum hallii]|jgi:hypothetical protein|uniref:Uncharacterized protein n=1 Tax=Panicum hallii TaxID=206008 RepID=A0A2T8IHQ5_9POAL|nr:hypothetical protein PAHAL_6G272800 [Panicum hallii]
MKVEDRPGELNGYRKPVICYRVDIEDAVHIHNKKIHGDQWELGTVVRKAYALTVIFVLVFIILVDFWMSYTICLSVKWKHI